MPAKFPTNEKDRHSGGKPRSKGVSLIILRKTGLNAKLGGADGGD
jgi:hypothetical protein